jgi:hypothetical protein
MTKDTPNSGWNAPSHVFDVTIEKRWLERIQPPISRPLIKYHENSTNKHWLGGSQQEVGLLGFMAVANHLQLFLDDCCNTAQISCSYLLLYLQNLIVVAIDSFPCCSVLS